MHRSPGFLLVSWIWEFVDTNGGFRILLALPHCSPMLILVFSLRTSYHIDSLFGFIALYSYVWLVSWLWEFLITNEAPQVASVLINWLVFGIVLMKMVLKLIEHFEFLGLWQCSSFRCHDFDNISFQIEYWKLPCLLHVSLSCPYESSVQVQQQYSSLIEGKCIVNAPQVMHQADDIFGHSNIQY